MQTSVSQVSTFRVHFLDVQTGKARFSRLGTVVNFLGLLSLSSVGQNLRAFPHQTVPPSSTHGKHRIQDRMCSGTERVYALRLPWDLLTGLQGWNWS